jgi:hypothetical protein
MPQSVANLSGFQILKDHGRNRHFRVDRRRDRLRSLAQLRQGRDRVAILHLMNGLVVLGSVGPRTPDDPDIGRRRIDALDGFGQLALPSPGGTSAKRPAPVPVVRLPGQANTSDHMSSIGNM